MQHVTAFSRAQTVPAAPKAAPKKTLWILNSWRDLILYVGTPLFLVPMFLLAQTRWSAQDIYVFVAAFGAMGHHLPGMIRAYGDRALFDRFRWRFIFAPIFLLAVCVAFYWWDLKGIVLVVFFWGVWHGMMQTYGFCRIYDAKTGSFATLTRRLDFATCATWFAAAVLLSSQRMTDTLETYYASGGPFIPPWLLHKAHQACAHRCSGGIRPSSFLLRWIHLESTRSLDARTSRSGRRKRICGITRIPAQLAIARAKMGCGICDSTRRALDRANAEQDARNGTRRLDSI